MNEKPSEKSPINKKLLLQYVLSLAVAAAMVTFGLYGFIILAIFSGQFYTVLYVISLLCLLVFLFMEIWRVPIPEPKLRRITALVLAGVIGLTVGGIEINRAYHNSFEKVSDQISLSLYDPFRENTLAASLNEPSTLSFTDNLPRIDGATALYPLYSAFARAVYPEGTEARAYDNKPFIYSDSHSGPSNPPVITCTQTGGAYDRLIGGEADIIFVAGPSQKQIDKAADAGVELELIPIGREAFVFFVNSINPVNELTANDIQKIYSGETKNWRDFGWKNTKIKAFQRPDNSGSQTALINFMSGVSLMTPPTEHVQAGMGEMIQTASYRNYKNAIGYTFLFYATEMVRNDKIKLLALDSVAPTRENVGNNAYPLSNDFYAVTAGTANPNAQIFIDWILSGQGQYLIGATGYTPLNH